jgi:hypothetical protein
MQATLHYHTHPKTDFKHELEQVGHLRKRSQFKSDVLASFALAFFFSSMARG